MTVNASTGVITWATTAQSPADAAVTLYAFDTRGAWTKQQWTVHVAGGNAPPVLGPLPTTLQITEGQSWQVPVSATDADGDPLVYWADNLPPGATFSPTTHTFAWTPAVGSAGTYPGVTIYVSDGVSTVSQTFTVAVAPANHPPTLTLPPDRTVRQGDGFILYFAGSDPDGGTVTYSTTALPEGAVLDANTGRFQWLVPYDLSGPIAVPITVTSSTGLTVTQTITFTVLVAPALPVFDPQPGWTVGEGQSLTFQTHATDPHDPGFVLPTRNPDGSLNPPGAVSPITYTVSGLPRGAAYDPQTATFSWTPDYTQAGQYSITVTATDSSDDSPALSVQITIPISVRVVDRPPQITPISNVSINGGQVLDVPVTVTDPNGQPLTLAASNALTNMPLPPFVTFTDNGDGTGVFHLAPTIYQPGNYALTLHATDTGGNQGAAAALTSTYTFVVTIVSANVPPQLAPINGQVALVDNAFTLTARASDIYQDALHFSLGGLPADASLTPGVSYGTAVLNWMPTAQEAGTYQVTVQVTDTTNGSTPPLSAAQTFTLVVRTTDNTPVVTAPGNQTVAEGAALNLQLQASDANSDPLTWSATGLPNGATLNALTGQLTWSPAYGQAGTYPITVSASDGAEAGSASFNLVVTHTALPPILVPVPRQYGRENTQLDFTVVGADPSGERTQLTASNVPAGATFTAATGAFQWTPDFTQAGDYTITFTMTSSAGLSDAIQVPIHIDNVDRPPVLNIPNHQATLGQVLTFSAAGTDPDVGDVLTYSALGLPQGATLNPTTGLVTWIPGPAQAGDYVVRFSASDGTLSTMQSVLIHAAVTPTPPSATIVLTPSFPVTQGTVVTVHAIASSVAPITSVTLTLDGQPVALDATGKGQVTAGTPGKMTLVAVATDADGLTGSTTIVLKVLDPTDMTAPVVALDPSLALAPLAGVTSVMGTVASSNLDSWSLAIATLGSATSTTIASGNTPVNDGALAQIDPGTLPNGFYQLRLTATDIAGRQSVTTTDIEVQTSSKPSAVQVTDTDLTVTLDGATVSVTRAYNSVAPAAVATFGPGWSLVNRDVALQTNLTLTGREALGDYPALQQGTRLYLTLPDGSRAGYTFEPVAVNLPGQPSELTYYYPAWRADAGVSYQLASDRTLLVRGGNDYYDQATGRAYNPSDPFFGPTGYTLTAPDGSQALIGANGIAETITATGHVLHVSDSGITAADGETIRFVKDAEGRIAAIQAPNGETVNYVYDAAGQLAEVVSSTRGVLDRYGYDATLGTLSVASRPAGVSAAYLPGQPPQLVPLTGDFGDALQFDGHPITQTMPRGGEQDYSFSLSDAEVHSTNTGSVIVRVVIARDASLFVAATPDVVGLEPLARYVDGNRTVALFQVTTGGTYLLRVLGATKTDHGGYTVSVDVAGDINADGKVDGSDSALLATAFGSLSGDANYSFAADLDASGAIDSADRQLLAYNYGFTADSAAPVFPAYFARSNGTVWTPTSGGGTTGGGTTGGGSGGTASGQSLHPIQSSSPPNVPTPAPIPLAPLTNPGFGITNGQFTVTDPSQSGFGWTERGQVTVASGAATLQEGGQVSTALTQPFFVPSGVTTLRFTIVSAALGTAANQPPDAFEAALLDAHSLQPLTQTAAGLGNTDAFLNVQSDGTVFSSPQVTIVNTGQNTGSRVIELDISGVAPGTLAVLSFDLLGFGAAGSQVTLDDILVTADALHNPVANADVVTTPENTAVSVAVLQNDTAPGSVLDPTTVVITTPPQHGTVTVSLTTGQVLYTPATYFRGTDTFNYRVRNIDGLLSNATPVTVTVTPVAVAPTLTVAPANGNQDTPIPLSITAVPQDTVNSDLVTVDISGLPAGATLSAGTIVSVGHYRLTRAMLSGLTFNPPAGYADSFTLTVTATTTVQATGAQASVSASLPVAINAAAGSTPVSVQSFVINGGAVQRSHIYTLAVQFNQDVVIDDQVLDVQVVSAGGQAMTIPAKNYSYNEQTWTLTINVDGLLPGDGQFAVQIREAAVASAANRAVTMDAGGSFFSADYLPLPFWQLTGDYLGTDYITSTDLTQLTQRYGATRGSANYNPMYDLNGDGVINRNDYLLAYRQLGKTTDVYPPTLVAAVMPANSSSAPPDGFVQPSGQFLAAVTDPSGVMSFTLSMDGSAPVNLLSDINSSGGLMMNLTDIATMTGMPLTDGPHRFVLSAADRFNNVTPTQEIDFNVLSTPPPAPTTPVILVPGGSPITGGYINKSTFTVETTATPGSLVTLYSSGTAQGSVIASTQGTADFSINVSLLGDGTYTFTMTATDVAGNVSAPSTPLTITVLTTPPVISSFGLAPESAVSPSSNQATGSSIDLAGVTAPGAVVRLLATGQQLTADNSGNFKFTNVPLTYGTTTFAMTAADFLGNTRTATTTVLLPAPTSTPPQVAASLANDTGISLSDGITSDPTIVGAINDAYPTAHLWVSVDGLAQVDDVAAVTGSTFRLTPALLAQAAGGTLPDGAHTVAVVAADPFGNQSQPVTVSLTLLTATPATPSEPSLVLTSAAGTQQLGNLTNQTMFSLAATSTAGTQVDFYLDGSLVGPIASVGQVTAKVGPLTAGTHTVYAKAVDVAGNVSAASPTLTFTIDLTPPVQPTWTVMEPTPGASQVKLVGTTSPLATVNLYRSTTAAVPAETVQADATGNFQLTGVPVMYGTNFFRVQAVSAAGNTSEQSGTFFSHTASTTPPAVSMHLVNDTGSSATDGLTSNPTVAGTVTDAGRIVAFQVSVNGAPFVGSLSSLVEGAFTLTPSVLVSILGGPIPDGPVSVRVVATDEFGNVSPVSTVSFTLDTTPPAAPAPLTTPAGILVPNGGSGFVTRASTLVFQTSEAEAGTTVVLYANGLPVASAAGGGNITFTLTPAEGTYVYTAVALDAAGNVGFFTAPVDVTVVRSITAPRVSLDQTLQHAEYGSGNNVTVPAITLNGTAKPGSTVTVDGTLAQTTANANSGAFTLTNVPVNRGANTLVVRDTDAAGNTATSTINVTMHNVTPPTITLGLVNDTSRVPGSTPTTSDPTVRAVIDDISPLASVQLSINSMSFVDVSSDMNGDQLILTPTLLAQVFGGPLSDGSYQLSLQATDVDGNVAAPVQLSFTLIETPPAATAAPDLLTVSNTGVNPLAHITRYSSPSLRVFAARGDLATFYDGSTMIGQAISTGVAQIVSTPLSDGVHQITAIIEDAASNFSSPTPALTLTVKTTLPATPVFHLDASLQDPVQGADYTTATQAILDGQTDPGMTLQIVGTSLTTTANANGNFTFSQVPLAAGPNTLVVQATDSAGNTSQYSLTITSGPLMAPVITGQSVGGATVRVPAVSGTVASEGALTSFLAGFDAAAPAVNVLPDLQGGSFTFSAEQLAEINGAPLSAGTHHLHLVARDSHGLTSAVTDIVFTLDLRRKGPSRLRSARRRQANTLTPSPSAARPAPPGTLTA